MIALGENIRRLRKECGRSQGQIQLRTGIDAAAISRLETGQQTNVQLETLRRLAEDGLGVPVAALFIDPDGKPLRVAATSSNASELHDRLKRDAETLAKRYGMSVEEFVAEVRSWELIVDGVDS